MFSFKQLILRHTSAFSRSLLLLLAIYISTFINHVNAAQSDKKTNHVVIISGFEFKPKELTVAIGDTITWLNKDSAPHNVTMSVNQKMITPNLETNQKFTYTIEEAFDYLCGLHPPMTGKIITIPIQD